MSGPRTDSAVAPVLLVDEVDRSDEEFEAFQLEVLSDFQVTIPEIGTITSRRPVGVITSNRTCEVHDALKRRCLYHWIDYPSVENERAIVEAKVPRAAAELPRQVTGFVQDLRPGELYKLPGVAETTRCRTARRASTSPQSRRRSDRGLLAGELLTSGKSSYAEKEYAPGVGNR